MSLLQELAVENSIYVNGKIQDVLVTIEKEVQDLEQKIADTQTETLEYVDEKFEKAVKDFVTQSEYAKDLADLNDKIDSNYETLDEKKIDKIESAENLEKVRHELINITDELDDRKIDKILAQKLIDDLNAALTDTINTLRISLQDQIDNLKLTKADKDTVQAELANIKDLISREVNRATESEEEITDNLNTEISRAKNQESILNTSIKNEIIRATDAELNITNNLNSEISRAKAKEQDLQDQIDENDTKIHTDLNDEISRAKAVEADLQDQITENNNTLTFNLSQEEQSRIASDIALKNELSTQTERIDSMLALSTTDKDSFKEIVDFIEAVDLENDTAFAGYVVSNNKAVQDLDDRLESEIIRAKTSEDVIQNQLNIETARASKREKEIALELEDEIVRASDSEKVLDTKISDENDRAVEEERYLQEQIDDCNSKHKANYLKLDDRIENEIIRATDSESTIQNSVNIETARASKREKEITIDLENEIQRAKTEENKISDNLDNEIDRAKVKEEYLGSLISQENIRATKEENYINSRVDQEISRAKGVENDLQDQIDVLEEDCITKNDILSVKLDQELLTSRTNENSLREDIINENKRAKEEEIQLNKKIETETTRAILEEQRLQTEINEKHRLCILETDKINTDLTIEKSRIDSILTASTADKTTFTEIVNFVNSINLDSDTHLPALISEIKAIIKDVDNKVILEIARASREEGSIKAELIEKILEIIESISGIDTKVENETTRSKNVEQILENLLTDHGVKLEKTKNDIKDLDVKFERKYKSLDSETIENIEELKSALDLKDVKFSNLLNEKTKNINEIEAKLKADYDFKFDDFGKKHLTLEERLNQTETKLSTTETILDTNTESVLLKLKEAEEKITGLNEKIFELENIDIDEKVKKTDSIKGLKDYLNNLNNDFTYVHRRVKYFDNWLKTDTIEETTNNNEEIAVINTLSNNNKEKLKQVVEDIEAINNSLDSLSAQIAQLSNLEIPEAYNDSEVRSLITKEEERAITKELELEEEVIKVKDQITSIIDGSTMDLNSFAEVIDYINSIDIENKDISDLITANRERLSSLETKTEALTQVLSDLNTIKDTLEDVQSKNINLEQAIAENAASTSALKIDSISRTDVLTDNIVTLTSDLNELDVKLSNLINSGISGNVVEYDDSDIKEKIEKEEKRAIAAEKILDNKIEDEIKRSTDKELELENNFNDILTGRKIVSKASNASTLNGKPITDLVLKTDYVGLAEDGKALDISGNILSLTNSNGFIETVELPIQETSSNSSTNLPELRTEKNTLRSSQYITVKNTDWQNMRSIVLDAGVYNFNISTENYVNNWRTDYTDVDEFIGQALVLPQGDFDSYGSLTKSTYNDEIYKSKDTNMFNLMDCTQDDYNNTSGQIVLKERQEVRIMLRSLIRDKITFLIKTQLYKLK